MSPIRSGIRRILSGNKQGARKYSFGAGPDQRVREQKTPCLAEQLAIGFNVGIICLVAHETISYFMPGAMSFMRGHSEESVASEKGGKIGIPGDDGNWLHEA